MEHWHIDLYHVSAVHCNSVFEIKRSLLWFYVDFKRLILLCTCNLVSNLMSAGAFESLQLFCLMNFVFTFQKLSEACELSVSVIMFDMNAILVCNSKLLSCCTPFRLSGKLPFTENDPAETEARIQAAKFDLSKLYQNVSQSASLFLKKILCSYPWWVKH